MFCANCGAQVGRAAAPNQRSQPATTQGAAPTTPYSAGLKTNRGLLKFVLLSIITLGIYAVNDKGEFAEIKKELVNSIKDYKDIKQVHGFYVDKEKNNIYFDLIIDFDCENPEKVKQQIVERLKNKYPKYEYNVILDADFSD